MKKFGDGGLIYHFSDDLTLNDRCPYDKRLLQTRFLHILKVGIRSNNMRSELHETLKPIGMPDEDLFKSVNEVVTTEIEGFW